MTIRLATEIKVFEEGNRKAATTIKEIAPTRAANALSEYLNKKAGNKAKRTITAMNAVGIDMAQFMVDGHRIRISLPS